MRANGTMTRRHVVVGTVSSTLIAAALRLGCDSAVAQPIPKRKNIDALTPTELDNYKHAVGILKQRSSADPTRQDGYVYQAALHNKPRMHPDGSVGACEHGSEQFFPWHRPHLAGFEKLLRDSDPPNTANVTLPYWDWTKPPSGRMVPAAFEDQASPLFNSGRRTSGTPPMWDGNDILDMVREPQWDLFAGRPKGPDASYGAFEQSPHNSMHPSIGSTMANPSTAANDPIYWSFHAYIDLVWARWQRLHQQTFACGSCRVWLEPNSYTVDQMVTTKDWNYEYDYDFSPDGPPLAVAAAAPSSTPLALTQTTDRSATAALNTAPNDKRKILKIEKVVPPSDSSYRILVYVHPADVQLAGLTEDQRRQYLVRTITIWQSSGHHPEASDVLVDLTRALAPPAANRVVSIFTDRVPSADATPTPLTEAPLPKIQSLFRGLAVEER
jgi:hypothetical protein